MGMDVFGKAPTSSEGEYFRNNVWWWHPLAEYIIEAYPELAAKVEYWHSNDGDGLDAADAKTLGRMMLADVESGKAAFWVDQYEASRRDLPKEKCTFCDGTGIRSDKIGRQMGLNVPGGCNACRDEHGKATGYRVVGEAMYPASVENIEAFAKFAVASGGFKIC